MSRISEQMAGQWALPLLPPGRIDQLRGHVDEGWRERANCVDADIDLFYPDEHDPRAGELAAEAKSVCRGCPVKAACRAYALIIDDPHGVWGGTTPEERDELRSELSTAGGIGVAQALSRSYLPEPSGQPAQATQSARSASVSGEVA